jgi:hypothetical protein
VNINAARELGYSSLCGRRDDLCNSRKAVAKFQKKTFWDLLTPFYDLVE